MWQSKRRSRWLENVGTKQGNKMGTSVENIADNIEATKRAEKAEELSAEVDTLCSKWFVAQSKRKDVL